MTEIKICKQAHSGGGKYFVIKWRGERERGGKQQCNKQMEYAAGMEEMRNSENLTGRDKRTMYRYRDNTKMNRKGTGCEDWDSIRPASDKAQWQAPVSTAMKLKVC
jgi:hypothetical protein